MSPLRRPDDRNVDEMYGEKARRGAQFWVEAGELLGYRLCDGSLQHLPPEPKVDHERLFVEVIKGGDHLLWYSKTMKTISDLIEKVRNVFGELPHEVTDLTLMDNSIPLPRETELQNLMRLRVRYSSLPPLSTVIELEAQDTAQAQDTADGPWADGDREGLIRGLMSGPGAWRPGPDGDMMVTALWRDLVWMRTLHGRVPRTGVALLLHSAVTNTTDAGLLPGECIHIVDVNTDTSSGLALLDVMPCRGFGQVCWRLRWLAGW